MYPASFICLAMKTQRAAWHDRRRSSLLIIQLTLVVVAKYMAKKSVLNSFFFLGGGGGGGGHLPHCVHYNSIKGLYITVFCFLFLLVCT